MTYPPVTPSSLSSAPTRHLPVELLESIFSYACIDGGPTGRSLSLVSSHFREVARPIRFRYIALSGLRRIKSFLAYFATERAYVKVRVHHLFLSTWRDGEVIARIRIGRTPHSDTLRIHGPMDGPRWSVWMPIQEALNKELSHLLPFVLNAVAHDLSTLSIVHSWEFGAIRLPESFPLLREFTFCGPPPIFPGGCVRLSLQPSPCFPSLRQLHIVCRNISTEFWVHHSPALTHLRLSDLNCGASTLADELRRSLCVVLGRTVPEHQNQNHPPLAHIRLQCRAVPRGFYEAGTSAVEHDTFVRRLKTLRPHPTVRVDVLRDRHYRDRYWEARIRRDWQNALLSGPGWWVGGEEQEEGEDEVVSNAGADG